MAALRGLAWLGKQIQAKLDAEQAAIDSLLSAIIWLPPEETTIRTDAVPLGKAYVLPGDLFPDGLTRTVINTLEVLKDE